MKQQLWPQTNEELLQIRAPHRLYTWETASNEALRFSWDSEAVSSDSQAKLNDILISVGDMCSKIKAFASDIV